MDFDMGKTMKFNRNTIPKLQQLRDKPNLPFHIEVRLDRLLLTAKNIDKERDPGHRAKLIESFNEQWTGYLAEGGTDGL